MTHQIQHINSNTPGLFNETIRAFQVVQALGKGALDIAVISEGSRQIREEKVLEVCEILVKNQEKPGEFAEYVLKVKRTDKLGRPVAPMKDSKVKKVLIHWAGQSGDLRRGMTRRELAKFLKMAPTDTRLTQITKGVEVALKNTLGVRVGWLDGRFRLLTAKQVERKQKMRKAEIAGKIRAAEQDDQFIESRGVKKLGTETFQVTLFAELPEVADALTFN